MADRATQVKLIAGASLAVVCGLVVILRRRRIAAATLRRETALQFNFAAASDLDGLAFGSLRPGKQANSIEETSAVTPAEVEEWVVFMKSEGIKHVLSLLGDDELEWYQEDLDQAMIAAGFTYTRTSVFQSGALAKMAESLTKAKTANEKIVIHCSGGIGRAAIGLGLWLNQIHGKSPEEAKPLIEAAAEASGTNRKPAPAKLETLLEKGQLFPKKK